MKKALLFLLLGVMGFNPLYGGVNMVLGAGVVGKYVSGGTLYGNGCLQPYFGMEFDDINLAFSLWSSFAFEDVTNYSVNNEVGLDVSFFVPLGDFFISLYTYYGVNPFMSEPYHYIVSTAGIGYTLNFNQNFSVTLSIGGGIYPLTLTNTNTSLFGTRLESSLKLKWIITMSDTVSLGVNYKYGWSSGLAWSDINPKLTISHSIGDVVISGVLNISYEPIQNNLFIFPSLDYSISF